MPEQDATRGAVTNTDRELWRERPDDYYADSIHVTATGAIGINCGGTVLVLPLREWHRRALAASPEPDVRAEPTADDLAAVPAWFQIRVGSELDHLIEVIRFQSDPKAPSGYLHSTTYANGLIWRWALKWFTPKGASDA